MIRTTATCFFSQPDVLTVTNSEPFFARDLLGTISNKISVSSMLPTSVRRYFPTFKGDRCAIACKDNNGNIVGHVRKYVSKQMHFFIQYYCKVEMKVNGELRYSKGVQQGGLETPCMFSVSSEHEKMLHMFEEYVKDV